MNRHVAQLTWVLAGAILFNLIFWQEAIGLNAVLFDVFILAALSCLYAEARQSSTVRWLLLGHLTCLAMVLLHNTLLSKAGFIITLALLTAFAAYLHRSVLFAGGSVLLNVIFTPASLVEKFSFIKKPVPVSRSRRKSTRFIIFPLLLLTLFFVIYLSANEVFREKATQFGTAVQLLLSKFFTAFSWTRLLFLVLGAYITASILLRNNIGYFVQKEAACTDELTRTKKRWYERKQQFFYGFIENVMGRLAQGMLALKNENTTGIISLLMLNGLLLVINGIDVLYLWLGFDKKMPVVEAAMVHEGAEMLIVSILLAIAVILFFFRGNLNFYKRNKWLKYGAYAWIIQNTMLVFSVFLRDYYYISQYGLAYKRIGLLFFLLMVLIGLITVAFKIAYRKTTYYLFRVNAWAAVVLLVGATTVHWDEWIVGYNLQRKARIPLDVPFLLSLSDKTLPLLDRNTDVLHIRQQQVAPDESGWSSRGNYVCDSCYTEQLKQREELFIKKQQSVSWLSWNYADACTKKYFSDKALMPSKDR